MPGNVTVLFKDYPSAYRIRNHQRNRHGILSRHLPRLQIFAGIRRWSCSFNRKCDRTGFLLQENLYWKGFCDHTDYDIRMAARSVCMRQSGKAHLFIVYDFFTFRKPFFFISKNTAMPTSFFKSHTFFFHADPLLLSLYLFHPAEIPDTEIVFHDRRVTVNTFLGSQSRKRCSTVRTVQSQTGILLILDHILILDIDKLPTLYLACSLSTSMPLITFPFSFNS